MIRFVVPGDAPEVSRIYNYYVSSTVISFEEQLVSINEMENRIREITAKYPWLVMEEDGKILGFAYANKYRDRSAYRYTAEITIYMKNGEAGKGLGTQLMSRLIDEARAGGIHALISGITLPNERSVAIHEKFGFEKIAHFREVGFKFEQWLDVRYWELVLKK